VDASTGPQKVASPHVDSIPLDWSPDGLHLLVQVNDNGAHFWVLDQRGGETEPWLQTGGRLTYARFSPDGRWVAYVSDESGRDEVYVRPFPGPGGQYQVSIDGGRLPHWRRDGREIVYQDPQGSIMAVEMTARGAIQGGVPRKLFSLDAGAPWEAAPDHQRFLVAVRRLSAVAEPLRMVVDWMDRLERRR
jgi:Tol biopolymer transport system component